MAIWDLGAHALLDPPDLPTQERGELTELAELVLGLRGFTAGSFNAEQTKDLQRALALQVSLMAAQSPEAVLASSVGRAGENVVYREGVVVHPLAQAIVDAVLTGADAPSVLETYTAVRSLR